MVVEDSVFTRETAETDSCNEGKGWTLIDDNTMPISESPVSSLFPVFPVVDRGFDQTLAFKDMDSDIHPHRLVTPSVRSS
jgi:hypothetical protein